MVGAARGQEAPGSITPLDFCPVPALAGLTSPLWGGQREQCMDTISLTAIVQSELLGSMQVFSERLALADLKPLKISF